MNLRNIELDFPSISGGSNNAILTAIEYMFAFKDGKKTDEKDGYKVVIVLYTNSYEKISVKLSKLDASILERYSNNYIQERNSSLNPILVSFEGFKGKIYTSNTGEPKISAKADRIIFMED